MKIPAHLILGVCLLTSICTPAFSEKPLHLFFEKTATTESVALPSYRVSSGDWLFKILIKQGYSQTEISKMIPAIQELNPHIIDVNALRPGQILYLPPRTAPTLTKTAPGSAPPPKQTRLQKPYVVHTGDTLTSVLQQQGVPNALIYSKYIPLFQQLNPALNSTNSIRSGQQIVLPLVDPADLGLEATTTGLSSTGQTSVATTSRPASQSRNMDILLQQPPPAPRNATQTEIAMSMEPPPRSLQPQFTVTNSTSASRRPATGLEYIRTILTEMRFSFAPGDEEMYPTPGNEWLHVNLHETPILTTPWGQKAILCPVPKSAGWIAKATALGLQVCAMPADWDLPTSLAALGRTFPDSMRIWDSGRELSLSRNAIGFTVSAANICIVQWKNHKIVHIVWSRRGQDERPLPQDLPDILNSLDVNIIELDQFNAPSRLPVQPRQSVYIPEATPQDVLRAINLDDPERTLSPSPPATLDALLQIFRSKEMLRQGFTSLQWAGSPDRRLSLHIPTWNVGPRERKVILIDQRFGKPALVSLLAQEGYTCFVLPPSF